MAPFRQLADSLRLVFGVGFLISINPVFISFEVGFFRLLFNGFGSGLFLPCYLAC
jgi:hypothetical protein